MSVIDLWALSTAARTLWQESRGEPLDGQRAVAHVLVNRIKDGRWGASLGEVCLHHAQFDGWSSADANFSPSCRLHDDDPELTALAELVTAAIGGESDPTNGATHYYAPYISPPFWTVGANFCGKFGSQLFYKGIK